MVALARTSNAAYAAGLSNAPVIELVIVSIMNSIDCRIRRCENEEEDKLHGSGDLKPNDGAYLPMVSSTKRKISSNCCRSISVMLTFVSDYDRNSK